MNPKDYKYKLSFASRVTKIHSKEVDKYISLAGLQALKPLMPKNIDLENNPDLLGIVFNAAVGNYANRNYDIISNKTAVQIARNFVWKYINLNHERDTCVGVICNYGFSRFGSNEILTEEEALNEKEPINISIAAMLWMPTIDEDLVTLIENSSDESSPDYGGVSASWELYFNEYDIAVGKSKKLDDCRVVTAEEKDKLNKYLRMNDGSGKFGDEYVYTLLNSDNNNIISAGIGLVTNPAAEVLGIQVVNEKTKEEVKETKAEDKKQEIVASEPVIENISSISNFPCVSTNNVNMKYPFLKSISDVTVHESIASSVDSLMTEKLKEAADKYDAEISAKEKVIADNAASLLEARASVDKTAKELADLKVQFDKLSAASLKKDAEDKFNARFAYFDEKFELTEAHRKILASRLNSIKADEEFDTVKSEMDVLLAPIDKAVLAESAKLAEAAKKEKDEKKEKFDKSKDKEGEECEDDEEEKDGVKKAVASVKPVVVIPNTQELSDKVDFRAMAQKAFASVKKSV